MKNVAFAIVLLSVACTAQSARVIQLSPDDAAKVKQLYAQRDAIEKQIADEKDAITAKYLVAKPGQHGNCLGKYDYAPGWNCGEFEYSEDFRFIVPQVGNTTAGKITWGSPNWGCLTISPATNGTEAQIKPIPYGQ